MENECFFGGVVSAVPGLLSGSEKVLVTCGLNKG